MKTVDFRGREVELNELVGAVYYSGKLLHAKIHKINEYGDVKISFGNPILRHDSTISKWKSPEVIVKLNGEIVPKDYHVDSRTGKVIYHGKE